MQSRLRSAMESIADEPKVYLFSHPAHASPLLAVSCQSTKDDPFPEAANIMQNLTGLTSSQDWSSESWDQTCAKTSSSDEVRDLGEALEGLADHYDLWSFDVCVVKIGRLRGVKFVAIGSNVDKRKRAGNLALALTASFMEPAASVGWSECFSKLAESVRSAMARERALPPVFRAPRSDVQQSTAALPPPFRVTRSEVQQSTAEEPVPEELLPLMAYLSESDALQPWSQQGISPEETLPSPPLPPPRGLHVEAGSGARSREASADSDGSEVLLYRPQGPGLAVAATQATAWLGQEPVEVSPWARFEGGPEFEHLRRGLGREWDSLTIGTLGTEDTIPVGTDLDPCNTYNNAWAASKITDKNGRILLTHDLGWRILDAENLGFTYGLRVMNREKYYDVEGVKKAVAYYLRDGCSVVVVGQRQALQQDLAAEVQTDRCQVVVADNADDVIILKKAFQKRCPVVSRDLFRKQREDLRIDNELRQWYNQEGATLQVNYTFEQDGTFLPDHALQMPVLRPSIGFRPPVCNVTSALTSSAKLAVAVRAA